jgi:hypothetical protein
MGKIVSEHPVCGQEFVSPLSLFAINNKMRVIRSSPHLSVSHFCGVSPYFDCLCGLAVRVPGNKSRGLGSIPCATTFSEK